jgi:hypothetical protein
MASIPNLIKTQIVANLNALVAQNILRAVIFEDLSKNVLDLDYPGFPCAVVGMPKVDSAYGYNTVNFRTYIFDILIVQLVDNLRSSTDIEDLIDPILTAFDNDVTLNGYASLGVSATTLPTVPVSSKGKNYIVFNVIIKARAPVQLTYQF